MQKFFGKNRKNVIVTAFVAVFIFVSISGTYTIYAATTGRQDFQEKCNYIPPTYTSSGKIIESTKPFDGSFDATLGFICLRWKYHNEMNKYFDLKMDRLVEILQREDFYAHEEPSNVPWLEKNIPFNPPPFDQATDSSIKPYDLYKDKLRAVCKNVPNPSDIDKNPKDDNASSYCVSMGALEIYKTYVESLNEVKKDLPKESELLQGQQDYDAGNLGENFKNLFTTVTINSLAGKVSTRNDSINREIDIAGRTMEAAVAVYDEFRIAYPMHRWYEIIIKDLVKYKNKLRDVRVLINLFPGKFINATSKSCQ